MSEDKPVSAYEIGYKKPPAATRFKKGTSGNPKGRPKGAKNYSTIVEETLDEPVAVTESGKRRYISKRHAMYKQQVNKAVSGDTKAFAAVQKLDREGEEARKAAGPVSIPIHESDAEIIRHLAERGRSAAEVLQPAQISSPLPLPAKE